MAQTLLSDVVVPEVFTLPSIERTAEKWEFIQSGIVRRAPLQGEGAIPIGRGKTINLPFYQDLTGDDEVWDDADDIELNKITMEDDIAVVLTRLKAWGSSDLSAALTGSNPTNAILELVSDYWQRRYQKALISTVQGALAAFLAESPDVNYLDISSLSGSLAYIDGESFIDATHKLGDRATDLTAIAIHSLTEAWLLKNDLIEFIRDSDGNLVMREFQGRRVIIDDGLPYNSGTGVFTSILFGAGAITMVEEVVPNATETYRHPEKKGGTDALYTRRKFVMHPRGVKWVGGSGVPASATPSNTELANGAHWERVWESDNVKLVGFVHKVG